MRWIILFLLFASTVINSIDRQNLSVLARTIQSEFGVSDTQYAGVVQLFLVAYAVGMLATGWIGDRIGGRLSMALFVSWWSLANIGAALIRSVTGLGASRFLLGLGEAGSYTVAPKVVSDLFAPKERGLAVGVYTSGSMLGAMLAAPLIGGITLWFGWRSAFVVTGILGLAWVVPWLWLYKPPAIAAAPRPIPYPKFSELLKDRTVWQFFLARMITDPVWYFYLFWFPKYLQDGVHLSLARLAHVGWIVYLAADVGSILGGYASGWLQGRGHSPLASRLLIMSLVAAIIPLGGLMALTHELILVLALGSLVALLHLTWLANLTAALVDTYPAPVLGKKVGIITAGSALGGALSSPIIGCLVVHFSYRPVFVLMAFAHPIAWLVIRKISKRPSRLAAGETSKCVI